MDDKEIIVHQARRIAELEVELEKFKAIEAQLCDLMGKRHGDTMLVYVTPEEADLIDCYRRATPEGKALIMAMAERVAAESIERRKRAAEVAQADVSGNKVEPPAEKKLKARVPQPEFSGLPIEFFRRKT